MHEKAIALFFVQMKIYYGRILIFRLDTSNWLQSDPISTCLHFQNLVVDSTRFLNQESAGAPLLRRESSDNQLLIKSLLDIIFIRCATDLLLIVTGLKCIAESLHYITVVSIYLPSYLTTLDPTHSKHASYCALCQDQ